MEMFFNPKFKPYFDCEKRYAFMYGGAGSGKSFSAAQKKVLRCTNEYHRALVVRKIKNTIKESVFKLIKAVINDFGLSKHVRINNTEMTFLFHNGSEIITTGLDDPEKLKSIFDIDDIWIEEITELEEADFNQIDLRMRGITKYYKQITGTFNPISETHWLKKRFFDKRSDRVFTHHSTFEDNMFIDEEYKQAIREEYSNDPNMKRIYIDGKWGRITTGQEFYSQFKYTKHVGLIKYNPDLVIHLSFDFNVNPYMPASIWQVEKVADKYVCRNIDEIVMINPYNDPEHLCEEFIRRLETKEYNAGHIYIYGDATGKHRTTVSKIHNYDIIEQVLHKYLANYSMRVPPRNPLVSKRRMFMNRVFNDGFPIQVIINPDCKYMIADLESVLEDPDGKKFVRSAKDPISKISYQKHGHLSDTMDYFFCSLFEAYYKEFQRKKI